MRWGDVNYLCHGLEAEVICEDIQIVEHPTMAVPLAHFHGTINCPNRDFQPSLRVGLDTYRMFVEDAIVLLVPPTRSQRKKKT